MFKIGLFIAIIDYIHPIIQSIYKTVTELKFIKMTLYVSGDGVIRKRSFWHNCPVLSGVMLCEETLSTHITG